MESVNYTADSLKAFNEKLKKANKKFKNSGNATQLKKDFELARKELVIEEVVLDSHSMAGGYAKRELLEKFSYKNVNFIEKDPQTIPLDFRFFNYIASVNKFPMLKNRRKWDPILQEYFVVNNVDFKTNYGLPIPNLQASYLSLNKYGKPMRNFDEDGMAFAFKALQTHFGTYMRKSKVVDRQTAEDNMDKTTSAGFPWNQDYVDKSDLLEQIPEEFRKYCDDCWEYLLDPDYWFVFTNSLKEEIRPIEKIKLNKIRTFTASPAEAVVNGYRLFGDMNQKFYDSYLQTASAVGLCPFYGGWDTLYRKLKNHPKTKKPIAYELDESEYDSSLSAFLFGLIVLFRIECLSEEERTPENIQRIKNYYRNLVNSVIITADGHIIQKNYRKSFWFSKYNSG